MCDLEIVQGILETLMWVIFSDVEHVDAEVQLADALSMDKAQERVKRGVIAAGIVIVDNQPG